MNIGAKLACLRWPAAPADAVDRLRRLGPHVATEAPLFWLDATGLVGLYPSQNAWAQALLAATGGAAQVALGHHATALRLLVDAVPKNTFRIFADLAAERAAVAKVPIADLPLPVREVQVACKLGLHRLGQLDALAIGELQARLGPKLAELVDALRRPAPRPAYVPPPAPCVRSWTPDFATDDAQQLLFVGKGLLQALLAEAQAHRARLASLSVVLTLQPRGRRTGGVGRLCRVLTPAHPDNDAGLWLTLLRLWLEKLQLPAAVAKLTMGASLTAPSWRQIALWSDGAARDVRRAHEALAKVRALWGDGAVVHAALRPTHLPEACFVTRPLSTDAPLLRPRLAASVEAMDSDPLHWGRLPRVRRLFAAPKPLPGDWLRRLRRLPQLRAAALLQRPEGGLVPLLPAFCVGATSVSHGWWHAPTDRDYVYACIDGEVRWIYFDRRARAWFWHGTVD